MPIEALRTPDDAFAELPDFPYEPHYVEDLPGYEGLRMAYIDEGPRDATEVFLCLHGEPTWSFLYRKMIPVFLESGARVVAPDLFGFGRSDKPVDFDTYSFSFHRGAMMAFIGSLGLERVTLVCQDWGGLLGLTIPADRPELIARLLIMNTALGIGVPGGKGFEEWKNYVATNPDFDVVQLMKRACPTLSEAEAAAYGAPFPDRRYTAGVRSFPALVPVSPEMDGVEISKKAGVFWGTEWSGPTFMAIGMQDPVLGPKIMKMMRGMIRGCPEPMELAEAGHFVQESGEAVAKAALEAFAAAKTG